MHFRDRGGVLTIKFQPLRSLAYDQQCILACEQRPFIACNVTRSFAIQKSLDALNVFGEVLQSLDGKPVARLSSEVPTAQGMAVGKSGEVYGRPVERRGPEVRSKMSCSQRPINELL